MCAQTNRGKTLLPIHPTLLITVVCTVYYIVVLLFFFFPVQILVIYFGNAELAYHGS